LCLAIHAAQYASALRGRIERADRATEPWKTDSHESKNFRIHEALQGITDGTILTVNGSSTLPPVNSRDLIYVTLPDLQFNSNPVTDSESISARSQTSALSPSSFKRP
jgi:hypothetical protein